MIQLRSFAAGAVLLLVFLMAAPASAQSQAFTVGLLGGIGGTDESGFDQPNFQAFFAFEMSPKTLFALRAGQMNIDGESGDLSEGDLSWATISTEYRLPAGFYQSGLFIGLGYYSLQTDDGFVDDSAFGLNLGVTGDIPLTRHFSLMVEFSGHYADLESSQLLLMGQAGVAIHF